MIAGFEKPDTGKIIIDGIDYTNIAPYKRPLNMMFQNYALFPHMTIGQNVAYGLLQEKISKPLLNERVSEMLNIVGLTDLANRYPHQISGGQQQRAALARSLAKHPKVLLLDEPLGALDRQTRERTQVELMHIQNMLKLTFILITHDQEEALIMSDRIAVMKNGKIEQIGTPKEIYEYPTSRFVADFVGSVNIFHGYVTSEQDGCYTMKCCETNMKIIVESDKHLEIGQETWVALRPEEMNISNRGLKNYENHLEAEVIDIAFAGSQIIYHLLLERIKVIHVSVATSSTTRKLNLDVGSTAYVCWHDSDGVIVES
jgi:putrescine transport system ATP-binding protein